MRICKIKEHQLTLQEAMDSFLRFKEAQQISERTLNDYNYYLTNFLVHSHNSLDYDTLTEDVLSYFSNIPSTSPARFNHPYQNLSAFFNWAIKQDLLAKNPLVMQGISKKKDDGNIKPIEIDDVKLLLNSWDKSTFTGLRNHTMVMVMLDTGIRTSELRRLKDSDFDSTAKQISISKYISKTRKRRTVYLSDSTAKQLNKFIKVKPSGWSEYIFPTNEGNEMTSHCLCREFDKQCKKVGIKVTPYQLRHTFASYFVANGGNLFTLQDLMGHADIRMTRRYTEIDGETKKRQHEQYSPINALSGKPRMTKIK